MPANVYWADKPVSLPLVSCPSEPIEGEPLPRYRMVACRLDEEEVDMPQEEHAGLDAVIETLRRLFAEERAAGERSAIERILAAAKGQPAPELGKTFAEHGNGKAPPRGVVRALIDAELGRGKALTASEIANAGGGRLGAVCAILKRGKFHGRYATNGADRNARWTLAGNQDSPTAVGQESR